MVTTSATKLKANLGKYMRAVRAGKEIAVTDRGVPVARLVPFARQGKATTAPLIAKPRDPASPPLGQLIIKGIQYHGPSTLELLREDRDRR